MKKNIYAIVICLFIAACSPKTNPQIDSLTAQNLVLEKTTKINDLNLALEKTKLEITQLSKNAQNANSNAVSSANDASKATQQMNSNLGVEKAASKADNYAEDAADDTNKARKLNAKISKLNKEVASLQRKITKTQDDLNKLKPKVQFVPNNN